MGFLDLFREKEPPTPKKIVELAVFSLASELDLYRISRHLAGVFGNPGWERYAGRRSLVFILDEGNLADEIPYSLTSRLFEDGGGFVRLELDLSKSTLDIDQGLLWHRREFSNTLSRFIETALCSDNPEELRHSMEADPILLRSGLTPERIAGELDFGFSHGSTIVKIGLLPDAGEKLSAAGDIFISQGVFYLKSDEEEALAEIERWVYREGSASWHRLSLRRWLERMDDVRNTSSFANTTDFARFLRRVNHFILRERRFNSIKISFSRMEGSSEFELLVADFDPTSQRLTDVFSIKEEDTVASTLAELKRLSFRQERLFAAWVVLVATAGLFFSMLYLLFPGAWWFWLTGASATLILPLSAYYVWGLIKRKKEKPSKDNEVRISEFEKRIEDTQFIIAQIEQDQGIPQDIKDEILIRNRRELARTERLIKEEHSHPA